MKRSSRRSFLKKSLGALGFLVAGSFGAKDAGAWPFGKKGDKWVSIGKREDLADGKKTKIIKATLVEKKKAIKTPKLMALRKGDKVFVMSTECTHFYCDVELQADGSFLCPCHKATFDQNGAVTKGPAKKPLPWYEVKITEDGDVQVNINKTIDTPAT